MNVLKKGISLISLIITIVVIIILASITVYNSLDTVDDANLVKMEKEYNDVCTFVRSISTKLEADIIDVNLSENTLATDEEISKFEVQIDFTSGDALKIDGINKSIKDDDEDPKYGYHYISGKDIVNGIEGIDISSKLEKVENDYIINFYYGVVIAKVSPTKVNVSGTIR